MEYRIEYAGGKCWNYFLNSLFGVVPVEGLFREKGDFALKSGYSEKMQVR